MAFLRILFFYISIQSAFGIVEIPVHAFNWSFRPRESSKDFVISPYFHLSSQLTKNISCCSGTYTLSLKNGPLIKNYTGIPSSGAFISIPLTYGIKSVILNGRNVLYTNSDYSAAGPILALSESDLTAPTFEIIYNVESPEGFFAGQWMENFRLGTADEIFLRREQRVVFQRYVPLAIAFICLLIAAAIAWSGIIKFDESAIYRYFLQGLFSLGAFYLSMSGILRIYFPKFGAAIHLPLRELASLTFLRLVLLFSGTSEKVISKISYLTLAVIVATAIFTINLDSRFQMIAYIFTITLCELCIVYFLVGLLRKHSLERFDMVLGLSATILLLGSSADFLKVISYYFLNFRSPLPFLNRLSDPPIMLTSLFYLIAEAAKKVGSDLKAVAVKELSDEVLHDLRSPVTALRTVGNRISAGNASSEDIEIMEIACNRISAMCDSLRKNSGVAIYKKGMVDVVSCVRSVAREKAYEEGREGFEIRSTDTKLFAEVDAPTFTRIISNILSNACEATPRESKIEISIKKTKSQISVSVTNFGPKIPLDVLENIFKKRYSYGKLNGLGIALHSARKNLRNWGGSISISSDKRGTVVEISLPAPYTTAS